VASSPDSSPDRLFTAPRPLLVVSVLAAVGVSLAVALWPPRATAPEPSNIRARNDSPWPMRDIRLGGKSYGDLMPGQKSGYVPWTVAYRYASVALQVEGHTLSQRVDDVVGEKPLGRGNFTYTLNVHDHSDTSTIEINANRD